MITIEIVAGDFEHTEWRYVDSSFITGRFNASTVIPISEIKSINRKEIIRKKHYVSFETGTNQSFMAVMSDRAFERIYDDFVRIGNRPQYSELPVNKNKIETENDENVTNGKSNGNRMWIFTGVFVLLMIIGSNGSSLRLSDPDKVNLCKAYIGELFHRPVSIINNYMNEDGLIYVRYIRPSDNTSWSYVCDVSNDSMIWAGWLSDTQKWGRWRNEDRVSLKHEKKSNNVSFVAPNTNKTITVRLVSQ